MYIARWRFCLILLVPNVVFGAAIGSVRWQFSPSEDYNYFASAPAIAPDGTVHIGNQNGQLYAFTPEGKLKWAVQLRGGVHTPPSVAADGTIYVGRWNGGLTAVSAEGRIGWEFPAAVSDISGVSIGITGTIYFLSKTFQAEDYTAGDLVAVNPDGTKKWAFPIRATGFKPVVTRNSILIRTLAPGGETTQLLSLGLSGKLLWKIDGITTDVAVGGDGTLYAGGRDSQLIALRPNGNTIWTTKMIGGVASTPVIDRQGALYCGTGDGYVSAVDAAGKLLWVAETSGTVFRCGNMSEGEIKALQVQWVERKRREHPAIALSPALDEKGNVIVAASPGIVAFSVKGKKLWERDLEGMVGGAPVIGSDGTIYAGTYGKHSQGTLFALQGAARLQNSPWPMFAHDAQHTSHAR